jgi:hypothetical protein
MESTQAVDYIIAFLSGGAVVGVHILFGWLFGRNPNKLGE